MEIYRDTPTTLALKVPSNILAAETTVVDITIVEDGRVLYDVPTVVRNIANSRFEFDLPWEFIREDRDFYVDWDVKYVENGVPKSYSPREQIQIVTPILPLEEVKSISGWDDDNDVKDLERRVRYAIQTFTGQNFGKYRTHMEVRGDGGNFLRLPAPLLGVITANFPVERLQLAKDGLSLMGATRTWFGIKDAPPEDILDQFHYTNGPIAVNNNWTFNRRIYRILGVWGYHDVPGDVKQAARLLVADYACDESLWRDRYMNSVRAGNWRFEVSDLAFIGTGNVSVDQILQGYRKISLAVA